MFISLYSLVFISLYPSWYSRWTGSMKRRLSSTRRWRSGRIRRMILFFSLNRCAGIGTAKYIEFDRSMLMYTKVYRTKSKYIKLNRSILKYIEVYRRISKYIKVYQSISKYIKVYRSISKYDKVYISKYMEVY